MTSRGHSLITGVSHTGDTQPDSEFSLSGVFDPAVKAIVCTFIGVGAAVLLARLSFFIWP